MFQPYIINDIHTMEEALKLRNRVFVQEQNIPADIERDEIDANYIASLSLSHHSHQNIRYIAIKTENGGIIGTGRVVIQNTYSKAGVWGCISRIAVLKEYRGVGAGRLIVEKLEAEAINSTSEMIDGLYLTSHVFTRKFYEKLGYVVVHDQNLIQVAGIPLLLCEKTFDK